VCRCLCTGVNVISAAPFHMHAMFECQAFAGTSAKKRKVLDQTASDESPNVVHVKHEPSLMDISSQATSEAQVC